MREILIGFNCAINVQYCNIKILFTNYYHGYLSSSFETRHKFLLIFDADLRQKQQKKISSATIARCKNRNYLKTSIELQYGYIPSFGMSFPELLP